MNNSETEELIRQKAYELWILDGRPRGADQLYWLRAQRDLEKQPKTVNVAVDLAQPQVQAQPSRLRGHIDVMTTSRISGWVQDGEQPLTHLEVIILDDGVEIARLVASLFRSDLKAAGIGDGCYAYDYQFPEGFWSTGQHKIAIVFPADPTWVCSNPVTAD